MDVDVLAEELKSDEEAEMPCDGRERRYPELRQARSVFESERAALRRWRVMKIAADQRGEDLDLQYIAEMCIGPDEECFVERRGQKGHVLLWGDKAKLAASVTRVFVGSEEDGED